MRGDILILQEYINELSSGILEYKNNKIYLTGFLSPERLYEYYNDKHDCFFSQGIFDIEDLSFEWIKDNALFIIIKNEIEVFRTQFKLLKKDSIRYKIDDKYTTKVYSIRKCIYRNLYNYLDAEESLIFKSLEDLNNYILNKYKLESTNQLSIF